MRSYVRQVRLSDTRMYSGSSDTVTNEFTVIACGSASVTVLTTATPVGNRAAARRNRALVGSAVIGRPR